MGYFALVATSTVIYELTTAFKSEIKLTAKAAANDQFSTFNIRTNTLRTIFTSKRSKRAMENYNTVKGKQKTKNLKCQLSGVWILHKIFYTKIYP